MSKYWPSYRKWFAAMALERHGGGPAGLCCDGGGQLGGDVCVVAVSDDKSPVGE